MEEQRSHSQATGVATKSVTNTKLAVATAFLGFAALAAGLVSATNPCKSQNQISGDTSSIKVCFGDSIVYTWKDEPVSSTFSVRYSKDRIVLGSLDAKGQNMVYTTVPKGEIAFLAREYPKSTHVVTVMYRGMDSAGQAILRSKQDVYYPTIDLVESAPIISVLSSENTGVVDKDSMVMKFVVSAQENVDTTITRLTFAVQVTPTATSTSPNMMRCATLAPSGNGWATSTSTQQTRIVELESNTTLQADVAFRMENGSFCGTEGNAKFITFELQPSVFRDISGGMTKTFALVMDSTSLSKQSGIFSLTPSIIAESDMPSTSNIYNQAQWILYNDSIAASGEHLNLPTTGNTIVYEVNN